MNWLILTIIVGTILAKVFANTFNYKYDISPIGVKKKLYGILQHVFEVFMIGIPFCMGLIELNFSQFILSVIGFSFIYAFLMSTGFNLLTGRKLLYIGLTDPIDLWLRKIFNISNEFEPEYKDLSAKRKQSENFRKSIIFVIKFVLLVAGCLIVIKLM